MLGAAASSSHVQIVRPEELKMHTTFPGVKKTALTSIFLAASLFSQTSFAALQREDFRSANDGALVVDTNTNLEWLSPVFTKGQSFNSIAAGYQNLVTTEGFRYASRNEVLSMFSNNFGPLPTAPGSPAGYATVQSIFNTFGVAEFTTCGQPCPRTQGLTSDLGSSPNTHIAVGVIQFGQNGYLIDNNPWPDSFSDRQLGSWLVRADVVSAVPEPETYAMLLAGLGVVGFAARRKAKKNGASFSLFTTHLTAA